MPGFVVLDFVTTAQAAVKLFVFDVRVLKALLQLLLEVFTNAVV